MNAPSPSGILKTPRQALGKNKHPEAGFGAKQGKCLHIGRYADTIGLMGKMVGYMVTWTTYGTWLQGDKRGYVRDGKILLSDKALEEANKKLQKSESVYLTLRQKRVVEEAVLKEAERIGQEILALAVCSNHVHLVSGSGDESIESVVSRYKNVATSALKKMGLTKRIWTRGFDRRFCFNSEQLQQKIEYVCRHDKTG